MVSSNIIGFVTFVLLATCSSMPSDVDNLIRVPEACRGKQYCPYKPEGYELFEEKMDALLRQLFDEDNSTRVTRSIRNREEQFQSGNTPFELSPRSDWHNCPQKTKRQRLYLVQNLNEKEVETALMVQTKAVYQVFDVVTCAREYIPNTDEQCFPDLPIKKLGMKSTCVENYAQRNVYIYNTEQKKIEIKRLSFPVSCSCKISYKS